MDGPRFVVDENLPGVGRVLQQARHDVERIGSGNVQEELPLGSLDTVVIPTIARLGLILITDDKRIRTRPIEASLCIEHGARIVHLHRAGHLPSWDQLTRLVSRWEAIERHIASHPVGPWWLSVQARGVKPMAFQPGQAERK